MGVGTSHPYNDDIRKTNSCFRPTLDKFPHDLFFTDYALMHGAILFHMVLAIYLFSVVALLIQAYVVSSIKTLADNYRIASYSARNTIVVCGTLLPEFFVSLIGIFVSKGNLGAATVIGSCAANSLVTLGVVGLIISGPVKLSWYPLWRDNIFYLVTVTILLWTTYDHVLKWQECAFLVVIYIIYILIINFNHKVERGVRRIVLIYRTGDDEEEADKVIEKTPLVDRKKFPSTPRRNSIRSAHWVDETILEENSDDIKDDDSIDDDLMRDDDTISIQTEAGLYRQNSREGGISLFTEDGYTTGGEFGYAPDGGYLSERGYHSERGYNSERGYGSFYPPGYLSDTREGYASEGDYITASPREGRDYHVNKFARHTQNLVNRMKRKKIQGSYYITLDMDQYVDGPFSPFAVPETWYFKILWLLSIPAVCIFYVTIPDCRKPKWRSWYPMTLIISTLWVGMLTYVLVWIAVDIGYTFKVPDSVMGFAFLATGFSFSGIVNTYLQSQAGYGYSAVYSIYGSNVFNITINLGLVWFIRSLIDNPYYLNDGSIVYINLCQLIIVLTPLLLQFTRWRLNKALGAAYLFLYCCFTTIVVLLEYDIIGKFNPPVCRD